ncbi:glycoside hydrolase family 16 protein [candidate division KSB1 bacterium]|nr:glycoside hydrolase family 16 protein [candidate division KSB1 bacterium]
MKFKNSLLILCSALLIFTCKNNATNSDQDQDKNEPSWQLVWSDEFTINGLPDTSKWDYDVGGHGWGNQEKQYYTANRLENARVENGMLLIEARRDFYQNHEYTSARLVTREKGDWTYGKFEIRAKLPYGRGTWPALWMLPTQWTYGDGGWPDNGEIDIMEHVGHNPGVVHASIHCHAYNHKMGTQKSATINIPDTASAFHVYSLVWSSEKIEIYLDDQLYFTFLNEETGWQVWPFDKNFHLLLNIAVGGTWGGAQGIDNSIFPQQLVVDYVRVYQYK